MKKYIVGWIVIKLALLGVFSFFVFGDLTPLQFAQVREVPTPPAEVPDDQIKRETSDPFKGDLSRYDRENRAEKLQIQRVMDLLGITAGKKVADIGAGGGWFAAIAARRVGEKGKIYAVDINEAAIKYINDRKTREKLGNVRAVLGKTDDPLLKPNSIDAVLILNTYHEIAEPIIFMKNLRKSLRPKALVGIIDRDGDGGDHGIDFATVIKEAEKAGYTLKGNYDFVEDSMDYFLIFEVAKANTNDRTKVKQKN